MKPTYQRTALSLELEALFVRQLGKAQWDGHQIAGFIVAQRLDGLLAHHAPEWMQLTALEEWQRIPLDLDQLSLAVEQLTAKFTLPKPKR